MIDRQELISALEGLDPRDREVLDLSLHRRVPDEALADVFGVEAPEVARRRSRAIDRLAGELGVQRGQDLGHMLQALLQPETWAGLTTAEEEAPAAEDTAPAEAPPADAPAVEAEPAAAQEPAGAEPAEPVLDMLAKPDQPAEGQPGGRRRRLAAVVAAAATVLLPAGGIVAAATLGDDSASDRDRAGSQTRIFAPHNEGPLAAPFPSEPEPAAGYSVARIRRTTALYDAPGGRRKLRITARTEWRTPRVVGVVRQRGPWLAVQVPELRNGQVGWVHVDRVTTGTVPWSLHVDLSKRRLIVRRDGRAVRRMKIAIGQPGHPTPTGRFSITDKLRVSDRTSPYGCCVLALSGHQVKLPEGWPGGDRLAVHATRDPQTIGRPVSLGCMRAETRHARWMLKRIPVGAPMFIKS